MSKNSDRLLYSDFWNDHLVEVEDKANHRSLYFGSRSLQSRMSLTNPSDLVLSYTCYMALALLINPAPQNVLIIGIGSGSFVRFFRHHFANCQIDTVDYSQQTIDAARDYFQLPADDQISVYCADGRSFLQDNRGKKYDLILVDAFDDQGMAPTVYSELFFSLCADSLSPKGVVSANLWSDDKVRLKEIKTIFATYFEGCLYLPVPDRGNIVAIAMPFALPWQQICLDKKEISRLSKQFNLNFQQIIKTAKQNNLSIPARMATWLR